MLALAVCTEPVNCSSVNFSVCAKITRPLTEGGAYFKVCSGPVTGRVGQPGGPRVSHHLATLHPACNGEPRTRFTFISDAWWKGRRLNSWRWEPVIESVICSWFSAFESHPWDRSPDGLIRNSILDLLLSALVLRQSCVSEKGGVNKKWSFRQKYGVSVIDRKLRERKLGNVNGQGALKHTKKGKTNGRTTKSGCILLSCYLTL